MMMIIHTPFSTILARSAVRPFLPCNKLRIACSPGGIKLWNKHLDSVGSRFTLYINNHNNNNFSSLSSTSSTTTTTTTNNNNTTAMTTTTPPTPTTTASSSLPSSLPSLHVGFFQMSADNKIHLFQDCPKVPKEKQEKLQRLDNNNNSPVHVDKVCLHCIKRLNKSRITRQEKHNKNKDEKKKSLSIKKHNMHNSINKKKNQWQMSSMAVQHDGAIAMRVEILALAAASIQSNHCKDHDDDGDDDDDANKQ